MASKSEPNVDLTNSNRLKTPFMSNLNWLALLLISSIVGTFCYFYCIIPIFGNFRELSVVEWMWAVCGKKEYDYGHGTVSYTHLRAHET